MFLEGGLLLLKPDAGAPLQYAATASFLSKLYGDYLRLLRRTSSSCGNDTFSSEKLQDFAASQVIYIHTFMYRKISRFFKHIN